MNKCFIGLLAVLATLPLYAMDQEICSQERAADTFSYAGLVDHSDKLPLEIVVQIGNNGILQDLVPFILNRLVVSNIILQGHNDRVQSALFNATGDKIVTASDDNTAKIWDANTGQCLYTLQGHGRAVRSAQFNAADDKIVTRSYDNTAKIWDANTGKCLHTLPEHTYCITSAQFTAEGDKIVTTSLDDIAKIWDANTGICLHILQGHTYGVCLALFNAGGDKIVTISDDNTAMILDANTGICLHTLQGHGRVCSAQFNTAGDKIVTISCDKTAKIWDIEQLLLIENYICNQLTPSDKTAKIWNIEQLLLVENYICNQLTLNQLVVLYKIYEIAIQQNDASTNVNATPIATITFDLSKYLKLKDAYNNLIPEVKNIFDRYVTQ